MYQGIYNGIRKHEPDLQNVLERSVKNGLEKLIITGTSLEHSKLALKIAENNGTYTYAECRIFVFSITSVSISHSRCLIHHRGMSPYKMQRIRRMRRRRYLLGRFIGVDPGKSGESSRSWRMRLGLRQDAILRQGRPKKVTLSFIFISRKRGTLRRYSIWTGEAA